MIVFLRKRLTVAESTLSELASSIAKKAHEGQVDKAGFEYIHHPRRVAAHAEIARLELAPHLDSHEVASVAWLHDVVEDTYITLVDLAELGFPRNVLLAVELLTHEGDVGRDVYMDAIETDELATIVKYADTLDNTDPVRVALLAQSDPEKAKKLSQKYAGQMARLKLAIQVHQRHL